MTNKRLKLMTCLFLLLTIFFTSITTAAAAPKKKTQPPPSPAPAPAPAPTPTGTKQILGFTTYYYSGDTSSYNSMTANSQYINEIATATHITDGYGNISGIIPTNQITYAGSSSITPLVLLGNNFDGTVAKTLLESSVNRQNCIKNLLNIIKTNGYKGANIDIETVPAADRSYYTTFMSEVYAALKPLGYAVTVSVPAKTSDSSLNTWNWAYDYVSISKYVDQLMIMAYDEHYPGGSPGSVASISWVTNVVNYAVTAVTKEKLLLGVAAYGYDWCGTTTKAYSINGCLNLAKTYGAAVQWDDTSKSSYFKYTDTSGAAHTVWFEDSRSLGYKLDLVNSSGISGIGIWRLGLENADYWTVIKSKLGAVK